MGTAAKKSVKRSHTVLKAADFKARALAVMRKVHDTGEAVTVTSHGRPLVRIEPLRDAREPSGYGCMRGTFELLVSETEARGTSPAAWGTLREWREAFGR
jgi:prevent-host-death family protein